MHDVRPSPETLVALTDIEERTAKAIVNVFETGRVLGDYSRVTLIPGDTGQLTYGRSQTTLASRGLHDLVDRYCASGEARFAANLRDYLAPLSTGDPALNEDIYFHNLLRAAADDPAMRGGQDDFFDERYWHPALATAAKEGIATPLGVCVIYDSLIHGSWPLIRRRTHAAVGAPGAAGEHRWIGSYVSQRLAWLGGHRRRDLRASVYRPQTFARMIEHELWSLELPLVVRDVEINELELLAAPPVTFDGPPPRSRVIALAQPLATGLDVRLVQLALSRPDNALAVIADGRFGRLSERAVREFQGGAGLAPTGQVDGPVFDALKV